MTCDDRHPEYVHVRCVRARHHETESHTDGEGHLWYDAPDASLKEERDGRGC